MPHLYVDYIKDLIVADCYFKSKSITDSASLLDETVSKVPDVLGRTLCDNLEGFVQKAGNFF